MRISVEDARKYLVNYHGLSKRRDLSELKSFLYNIRCIQFDPLDQVGTNPNLVLQSRFNNYTKGILNNLLYEEKFLMDGWDKNMSIHLAEDYPFLKRGLERIYYGYKEIDNSIKDNYEDALMSIAQNGPMSSRELEILGDVKWSWGNRSRISRAVLELLFYKGKVFVDKRIGNRRYFDIIENHPMYSKFEEVDNSNYYKDYLRRRLKAVGMIWNKSSSAFLGIGLKSADRDKAFNDLMEELIEIEIEDIPHKFYILKGDEHYFDIEINKKIRFLAPLDNILWDRELIKKIFDFDYKWEVYKPKALREYGYYVLPILYGDKLIGRIEPKYNKKSKTLNIENIWWESELKPHKEVVKEIRKFLDYLEGDTVTFNKGDELKKLEDIYGI